MLFICSTWIEVLLISSNVLWITITQLQMPRIFIQCQNLYVTNSFCRFWNCVSLISVQSSRTLSFVSPSDTPHFTRWGWTSKNSFFSDLRHKTSIALYECLCSGCSGFCFGDHEISSRHLTLYSGVKKVLNKWKTFLL